MHESNERVYGDGLYYFTDEIWDHCLRCGQHWHGVIPSCRCSTRTFHIKDCEPYREMTKEEKLKKGREILARFR